MPINLNYHELSPKKVQNYNDNFEKNIKFRMKKSIRFGTLETHWMMKGSKDCAQILCV